VEISIGHALAIGSPENIYLSSDSSEILKYAEILKIKSILRSSKESSDDADANIVVKHFIQSNQLENQLSQTIVYLQPTSPFRELNLIIKCIDLHKSYDEPVVTVRKINDHPQKMVSVLNGKLVNYGMDFNPTGNRQQLLKLFIPSGSVYVFTVRNFLESKHQIPIKNAIPIETYGKHSIDIDSELDLFLAQKIEELNENEN
jgi:CMP-N-acetylneuraminic acid synthetase